ncbi:MAG TPA: hypothetical protein VLF79_00850 [Candidatus Saccharimonadales bacterium]|nr:hypothetical protein [Candidatus Saccharimonadales bacterium]
MAGSLAQLITQLQNHFPKLKYTPGQQFSWSPETSEIFYKKTAHGQQAIWSLLHETGHAALRHTAYKADFELLRLEIAAWEEARNLAKTLNIVIDEDHIEDCLDTYRDWLYKRSICPKCTNKSLQQGDYIHYRCFNCHTVWRVSANRFCRAYRSTTNNPTTNIIFT